MEAWDGGLQLGRALGHFIFSLIGLARILIKNIFQKLYKPHLVKSLYRALGFGVQASGV